MAPLPDRLFYRPPAQTSPTTIDLSGSSSSDYFGAGITTPGADYIIKMSPTVARTGQMSFDAGGARSIHIIGGSWALNDGANGAKNYHMNMINIAGWVFVEGMEADMTNTHADFLCTNGGSTHTPDVYFQNSRILNLTADDTTNHADIFQPQNQVGNVYVDKVTFSSNYQGFTIAADSTGNRAATSVHLNRVNSWYQAANAVTPSGTHYFLNSANGVAGHDTPPFQLILNSVYVDLVRGAGRSAYSGHVSLALYPATLGGGAGKAGGGSYSTGGTSIFALNEVIGAADSGTGTDATISNTKMQVSGAWHSGSPTADGVVAFTDVDGLGSYVPAGIGTNYQTPGYTGVVTVAYQ